MPTNWRRSIDKTGRAVLDFALTMLISGGLQVMVALLVWLLVFRNQPTGLSMALTLIGFGSWFLGAVASLRSGRRVISARPAESERASTTATNPVVEHLQTRVQRSGCGCTLLLSSMIPLALAFILRVQADMRAGRTWSDIFPPLP